MMYNRACGNAKNRNVHAGFSHHEIWSQKFKFAPDCRVEFSVVQSLCGWYAPVKYFRLAYAWKKMNQVFEYRWYGGTWWKYNFTLFQGTPQDINPIGSGPTLVDNSSLLFGSQNTATSWLPRSSTHILKLEMHTLVNSASTCMSYSVYERSGKDLQPFNTCIT